MCRLFALTAAPHRIHATFWLLDAELGDYRPLVESDTDSERLFALVTRHIDLHDGDVGAGIA